MFKKLFMLFKIGRKLSISGAISSIYEIYNPPIIIKIFFSIIGFSFKTKKNNNNLSSGAKLYLNKINYKGCVYCVDENKEMLDLNKIKFKGNASVKWCCNSAEKLPFKNNHFDYYTISLVLEMSII